MSLTDRDGAGQALGTTGEQAATLAALWTLAVTQPVLDVVGNYPSYWIASRVSPSMVLMVVLLITAAPAAGFVCVTFLAKAQRILFSIWNRVVFPVIMTVLLALAVFYTASTAFGKPLGCLRRAFWRERRERLDFDESQWLGRFFRGPR